MYLVFYALHKVRKRFSFYPPSLTHSYSHTHKHNIGFLLCLYSSVEIDCVHVGSKSNVSHSLKERGELHLKTTWHNNYNGMKPEVYLDTHLQHWFLWSQALPLIFPSGGEKRKKPTLEHSENEEKPWRQMAETISPIRRSYFSCHARVCKDAVSISEHRHEAELLLLFWLEDWTCGSVISDHHVSIAWQQNETKIVPLSLLTS